MSEMTTCNYCNLQRYKHEAKSKGRKIIQRGHYGGIELYSIPKGLKYGKMTKEDLEPYKLGVWMMEISRGCCC